MAKHARTKACAITPKVREEVERRDGGCCIFCGAPGRGEAHVIGRAQGGLGVPENIVTVCRPCHGRMDNSQARKMYVNRAIEYLKGFYPNWDEHKYIFSKWG